MKKLNFLGKLEMGLQLERLVIGIEEPILVKDLGEIMAKIDSGNGGYNVIHGEDITYQGNQVLFLTYDGAGNPRRMSKKLKEELEVHIGGGIVQKRPVIELDIKFANEEYKKIPFSITDRTENTHRILISKEFVENTIEALIDVGAKNISNLKYDVDYEPVHEASNDFKNINTSDTASSQNTQPQKKGNIFGRAYDKAASIKQSTDGVLDKISDIAMRLRPHGDILPTRDKNKGKEEYVNAWKQPAKAFANYKDFYKQDQELIKSKIITNDAVRAELDKGDQSNLLIKDGKILANKLRGISIFSYLLKKGDAGPAGKGGSPIKGQEQRRELWFKYNNDSKKALKALQKNDKSNQEKTPQENETMGESFSKILNKVSKLILEAEESGVNSRSFDATKMERSSFSNSSPSFEKNGNEDNDKITNSDKSSKTISNNIKEDEFADEVVEEVKSESERIFGLKGFILYYIPLYNKDNKVALQSLNERILSGSFDDSMSSFITTGQGDNVGGAEKITTLIKQFVTSNQKLLSELPGVFALCYSQTIADEKAPRNIVFIPKSVIVSPSQNAQENAPEAQEDVNYITSLREKLNLPPEKLDASEEQNLVSLLNASLQDSNENNQREINVEALKEKLGLPNVIEANDDNFKSLSQLLSSNQNENQTPKIDIEKLGTKLNLPKEVKEEDLMNILNALIQTPKSEKNGEVTNEIDENTLKSKLGLDNLIIQNDDSTINSIENLFNELQGGKSENIQKALGTSTKNTKKQKKQQKAFKA